MVVVLAQRDRPVVWTLELVRVVSLFSLIMIPQTYIDVGVWVPLFFLFLLFSFFCLLFSTSDDEEVFEKFEKRSLSL